MTAKDFFRPAKMLVSVTKWPQLIVVTSFAVILAKNKLPPYFVVGVGKVGKVRGRGGGRHLAKYLLFFV